MTEIYEINHNMVNYYNTQQMQTQENLHKENYINKFQYKPQINQDQIQNELVDSHDKTSSGSSSSYEQNIFYNEDSGMLSYLKSTSKYLEKTFYFNYFYSLTQNSNNFIPKEKYLNNNNSNINIINNTNNIINIINNNSNNNNKDNNKKEDGYTFEMYGKKGWLCKKCKNFNYETRKKCNRCGSSKKAIKFKNINNEKDDNKTLITKGDWLCTNCHNLNYGFRKICNRCKLKKNISNKKIENDNYQKIDNIKNNILLINNVKNINNVMGNNNVLGNVKCINNNVANFVSSNNNNINYCFYFDFGNSTFFQRK